MQVSATTWGTLSKLLDEALDLEPPARAVWFAQLSATQPALAPSVRKLLEAHASSETADVLARLPTLGSGTARTRISALAAGDRIGPYRLKRELGTGGMADVWLAERADGAFTREVALKLPLINRLRRDLALRFARERDILARLEHPYIARLYDAGVTDDGLPYLAMEYVDGQPIAQYCDQHQLGIETRLELFRQVLDAVQFAHANLIIHRDLKPTNILVTADAQVRLLDFGIAKLLADDDTARETQLTQLSGRALTPDYASPEQIKGEPLTIATDIYSLGVVLYELLAGSRPYKLKMQSAAQLEQAIITIEPQRLSGCITAQTAHARSTSQQRLLRALAGDLDTIALKALRKSPAERFPTIAAFAEDLQRHIDGRPVHARPASWSYRTRKFVARNKLAVAATGVVATTLVVATIVSLRQAQVAIEQTTMAQREAKRAQAVQRFLLDLFKTNTDAQADPVRARETTARELLDIGAARVTQQLKDVPEVQDEVLSTLSDMYRAVGLDDKVAEMERQRVETRRQMFGPRDPRVAEALIDLARSLQSTSGRQQIPSLLAEAKSIIDSRPDTPEYVRSTLLVEMARLEMYTAVTQMRQYAHEAARLIQLPNARRDELATAWRLEARANYWLGDWSAAVILHQRSIAEALKSEPEGFNLVLSNTLELAEVHARRADVATAEQLYRRIVEQSVQRNGEGHVDTVHAEIRLAEFLHTTSRRGESRLLREAILKKLEQGKGGDTPNLVGYVERSTATTLFNEGLFESSERWTSSDLESRRRLYPNSTTLATALLIRARLLIETGHYAEAASLLAAAAAVRDVAFGPGALLISSSPQVLAQARLSIVSGRAQDAVEPLQKLVSAAPPEGVLLPIERVRAQIALASAYLQQDQTERAIEAAQSALEQVQRSSQRNYYQTLEADAALQLGRAQLQSGDVRAAQLNIERGLQLRTANDDPNSPWIAEAQIALAQCSIALGNPAQARSLIHRAAAIQASHSQLGSHYKQPLADVQARLRTGRSMAAYQRL